MEERIYDLIFICRPDTPDEEIDKLINMLGHAAAEKGAKFEKVDKWGVRKLAYHVKKLRQGAYVCITLLSSDGGLIHELERRLKVTDAVIKYQTIRLDEELKRQQKLGRRREVRAARRPRRAVPASASTAEPSAAAGNAASQSAGK
jgi:small subunit ribosomal protein S6